MSKLPQIISGLLIGAFLTLPESIDVWLHNQSIHQGMLYGAMKGLRLLSLLAPLLIASLVYTLVKRYQLKPAAFILAASLGTMTPALFFVSPDVWLLNLGFHFVVSALPTLLFSALAAWLGRRGQTPAAPPPAMSA